LQAPAGAPGPGTTALGVTRWEYAGGDLERDAHWREHKKMLDAHLPFRGFQYSAPNGKRRLHFKISGKPVFDASGVFMGYRGTATDQTEFVEAQERERRTEELLRDALDSMSEGFLIYDRDDRLVMLNERYRSFYPDLIVGRTFE